MADTYEKDLAQKSSFTVNDFVRVVGSDNVSYKQGVRNVAETFAQALPRYSAVTSLKDWGVATNGRGITITNSTTTDTPSQTSTKYGVAWTNSYSDGTNPWANLFWSPAGSTDIYMCQKTNESAWSDWVKLPTRAEVDALNSKTSGTGTAENQYCSFSYTYIKRGNICQLYVEATPKQVINNSTGAVNLSDIPKPATSSYSATYDPSSASTICGSAELNGAKNVSFYGARTAGHVYKAGFTYAIN